MQALILAAGKGTRMRGLCDYDPKPMLPLANRPILDAAIWALANAGITQVFVVIGYLQEKVRAHFQEVPPPIPVKFIVQHSVTGTGSATLLGRSHMKADPFMLLFGDIVVALNNYADLMAHYCHGDCDAILSVHSVPDPTTGAATYVESGMVKRIVEKPTPCTSTTTFDNAGLFVLPPQILKLLESLKPSPRGEYELTDAISQLLSHGARVASHEILGYWFNLTDPETMIQANHARLCEQGLEQIVAPDVDNDGAKFGANVSVGARCRLARNSHLANCILAPEAEVGEGAELNYVFVSSKAKIPSGARLIGTPDNVRCVKA